MPIISIEYSQYWDHWDIRYVTEKQESLRDRELGGRGPSPKTFGEIGVYKYDNLGDKFKYKILFESDDLVESYSKGLALITDLINSGKQPKDIIYQEYDNFYVVVYGD